jgi:hypothetical protein
MNDKRIEANHTNQSVPKKIKIVQSKNQASPVAKAVKGQRARRSAAADKKGGLSATKGVAAQTAQISTSPKAGASTFTEPSDEAIRLRAYFISERRRRFALPGDAESDWLEARRQLLSETGPR